MNRQQYLEYIDHFNNKRYDKVTGYFAPDITVEYFDNAYGPYGPSKILHGAKEFEANYRALHEHTKEVLELGDFLSEGKLMFVELYTEFITFKDPAPGTSPYKKGGITIMTNWATTFA